MQHSIHVHPEQTSRPHYWQWQRVHNFGSLAASTKRILHWAPHCPTPGLNKGSLSLSLGSLWDYKTRPRIFLPYCHCFWLFCIKLVCIVSSFLSCVHVCYVKAWRYVNVISSYSPLLLILVWSMSEFVSKSTCVLTSLEHWGRTHWNCILTH